jgi:hypothetical protein
MGPFATFYAIATLSGVCLASTPTVTITNGTIVGRSLPEFDQDLFLGIPYANSPSRFNTSIGRTRKFSGTLDARQVHLPFDLLARLY